MRPSAESDARTEAPGLDAGLVRMGVNLAGVLAAVDYDACVPEAWRTGALLPEARSVVVLATGGPAFFRAFRAAGGDSLDAFLVEGVRRAVLRERGRGHAAASGFYFEQRPAGQPGARFVDMVALGGRAGLGAPGRLGLLLHPRYGPWLGIRALLFTSRPLPASAPDPGFAPCDGCPAPCAGACPGDAVRETGFDGAACLDTSRRVPSCRVGCAARRACVVGQEHRYDADAEAWHRQAALRGAGIV